MTYATKKRRRLSLWGTVISAAVTLILAWYSVSVATSVDFNKALAKTILSLICFLTITILTRHFEMQAEFDELRDLHERKIFRIIGTALDSVDAVPSEIRRGTKVKNVFVPFGLSEEAVDFPKYWESVNLEKRRQMIANVVDKGGTWQEICSEEALTYRDFAFQGLASELRKSMAPNYEAFCLRESYPIINFTLFEQNDGSRTVWFGWGLHPNQHLAPVYSTNDEAIVDIFDKYWFALKDHDATSIEAKDMFNREVIAGTWISATYDHNGYLQDIIAICIRFRSIYETGVDRRYISICGEMIKENEDPGGGFESKASQFHTAARELWFAYERKELGRYVYGASHYTFHDFVAMVQSATTVKDVKWPVKFSGWFVRQDSEHSYHVYGERIIESSESTVIASGTTIEKQNLLRRHRTKISAHIQLNGGWPFKT